jgi:hypothetical protein
LFYTLVCIVLCCYKHLYAGALSREENENHESKEDVLYCAILAYHMTVFLLSTLRELERERERYTNNNIEDSDYQYQPKPRFDASAQSDSEPQSPLALTTGYASRHCVSLLPEIQTMVNTGAATFLKMQQKANHTTRRQYKNKMESNDEHIPNSAKIEVTLQSSKLAQQGQGYQDLGRGTLDSSCSYS